MTQVTSPTPTVVDFNYSELLTKSQDEALQSLLNAYPRIGLQATQLGEARKIIQRALYQRETGDVVFLAYTSNLVSSGLRDTFAWLARERLIDVVISTAGGIEEDVIKCLGKTLIGQFNMDGKLLRRNGVNRVGNLLLPNDNYCRFEDFFMPVLKRIHEMQRESRWESMTAPSEFISAMGAALERDYPEVCESSLIYWCYRNNIPVFSPALTDGSMGDMIYFYNFSKKGLVVDPIKDVVQLRLLGKGKHNNNDNNQIGRKTCMILGGGLPKHHLLKHVYADAVVYVSTGLEVDACPSSCNVKEDRENNVISINSEVVRVHGDATFVFPLLVCHNEKETDAKKEKE